MFRLACSLLTTALLLSACTGAQGPLGPEGAQGTQGATGQAGAVGQTGTDGTTGPAGQTGATGAPGSQGTPGTNGSNGTPGPSGTPGAPGPTGPTGPQGPTGNANVEQYSFGPRNANNGIVSYRVEGFKKERFDSTLVLAYIKLGDTWKSVPGNTAVGTYIERSDFMNFDPIKGTIFDTLVVQTIVRSTKDNSQAPNVSDAFRIIVIPVSSSTALSLHGPDLNDYHAVKAYYHLGD